MPTALLTPVPASRTLSDRPSLRNSCIIRRPANPAPIMSASTSGFVSWRAPLTPLVTPLTSLLWVVVDAMVKEEDVVLGPFARVNSQALKRLFLQWSMQVRYIELPGCGASDTVAAKQGTKADRPEGFGIHGDNSSTPSIL